MELFELFQIEIRIVFCLLHVLNKCGFSHVVCRHLTSWPITSQDCLRWPIASQTGRDTELQSGVSALQSCIPSLQSAETCSQTWPLIGQSTCIPASDWSAILHTGLLLAEAQTLINITISQSEQEECLLGLFSSFPGEMKTERERLWGNPWL